MADSPLGPVPCRRITVPRLCAVGFVGALGLCEALTTSAWFDPAALPGWVSVPIVMIGFFGVLLLWSFLGNGVLAVVTVLVIWRGWRWPFWSAAMVAAPYWVVAYRLSPKPW